MAIGGFSNWSDSCFSLSVEVPRCVIAPISAIDNTLRERTEAERDHLAGKLSAFADQERERAAAAEAELLQKLHAAVQRGRLFSVQPREPKRSLAADVTALPTAHGPCAPRLQTCTL